MSLAAWHTPQRGMLHAQERTAPLSSQQLARRGGRPARLPCRADAATRSLEQAVRVLNKVIGIASSPKNRAKVEGEQKAAKPAKPKWVAFTGAGSAKVDAPGSGAPGRALANYLALPVSQYSLLDPKFVERLDEESFRVTVPLDTVTGVQVRPQVLVRVTMDEASGSVTFSSETASLGDPALDKELALQLRATLGSVAAGDRAAFRRLARRKPPAWSPHLRPDAAASAADDAAATELAQAADIATAAGRDQSAAVEAAAAAEDPLGAAAGSFRPLQPDAIKASAAAMAGKPADGAVPAARIAANGSGGSRDGAAGSSDAAESSGEGDAVMFAVEVDSGNNDSSGADSSRSKNGAAESPSLQNEPAADAAPNGRAAPGSGAAGCATAAAAAGGASLSLSESNPQQLAAKVDLRVSLNVPPVLRMVPGPLLGYAGGLVLKVALQALLPSFLQLLAQDFAAWTTGDPKRGSNGGGLLDIAEIGGGSGGEESGEAAQIPEEWQPCTKEGEPVTAAGSDV